MPEQPQLPVVIQGISCDQMDLVLLRSRGVFPCGRRERHDRQYPDDRSKFFQFIFLAFPYSSTANIRRHGTTMGFFNVR